MSTVEEIVEAIRELPPEKRDEVRRKLGSLWSANSRQRISSLEHEYRAHWPAHNKSASLPIKRARPRRPPIQIKGKPISETVVEDRR
jgi:hypothetical protein